MNLIKPKRKKFLAWKSITLASMLWLGLGGTASIQTQTAEASTSVERITSAYVHDRAGLTYRDQDAKNLDQLNFSFGLIQDGKVTGSHWQSIDAFKAYIQKHPHITPVLAIGGWGADGFSQAAATAEGRKLFVDSTMELLDKHGFMGVDIDWEYPGSSVAGIASSKADGANLSLLLADLRSALDQRTAQDGKPRILALAMGADPVLIPNLECQRIGQLVDQLNLMTYDLQTPKVASHHTALYSTDGFHLSADHAIKAFHEAGIPKEKIMMGAAFYGRLYTLNDTSVAPVFSSSNDSGIKSVTYRQIMANDAWVHRFDNDAKAAYATSGDQFLSYDSVESISHKADYVIKNGLHGMMCWEYGGDDSGILLDAMRKGMGLYPNP